MRLLTVPEVAKRLRLGERTVRRWAGQGILPVIRMSSRKLLFDEAAIEAVLKERQK